MIQSLFILFAGIATSFFFFPFQFAFLPGVNTKMLMAVVGVAIAGFRMLKNRTEGVSREFLMICIWATAFSLICLHSVTYNNTPDYAYASYIVSMLVWLSAAYAVCQFIQYVHGTISFRLLADYLIGVCVFQCLIALLIDFSMPVKMFIDAFINQDEGFLTEIGRIYGIGASLDVAGTRFAAVLVVLMVLICTDEQVKENKKWLTVYLVSFVIISAIGNMIARTTSVGLLVSLVYFVFATRITWINIPKSNLLLWIWMLGIFVIMISLIVFLYNYNETIHDLLRFGFEGFFNWIEHGKWETRSTDHLETMWKWPESDKTWLWGDGYFNHPDMLDPTYKGRMTLGFYMATDIGYLRFIYYCGLPGMLVFCSFLLYMAVLCYKKYDRERILFFLLIILQLAIFSKVATDIFLFFAYFFCARIQRERRNLSYYRK